MINPGNPRRAARVFLETRRSLPLGTAAGPASPATELSQPAPMWFPTGAAPCAPGGGGPFPGCIAACALRAALQKSRWDLGERGQLPPGSRLRPLRSETCKPLRLSPVGRSSGGGFLDEQFCKKTTHSCYFIFFFNFNTFGSRAVFRNLSRSWHPRLICHPP